MSDQEQIGKHKGAVETLLHEKKELSRILQIVNSQLQRHLSALEDSGIDTDDFINQVQQQSKGQQTESDNRKETEDTERRERSDSRRNSQESNHKEDEKDADELLEGENDLSDRDFNPNR